MHHGAHHALPVAFDWGDGTTSSSDRQFFRSVRRGDFYTHVSDQHGPYSARLLSATGHEAPYVLDGLLHHGTARRSVPARISPPARSRRSGTGCGLRHAMQAAAAATAPSTPARSTGVETDRSSRLGRAR